MASTKACLAKIEKQLDDYAKIKEIWQKHCMSLHIGNVEYHLDEVLSHYKELLGREEQERKREKAARFEVSAAEAKRELGEMKINFLAGSANCRHYNVAQMGGGYTRCADCGRSNP